jgi:hypothetical protein
VSANSIIEALNDENDIEFAVNRSEKLLSFVSTSSLSKISDFILHIRGDDPMKVGTVDPIRKGYISKGDTRCPRTDVFRTHRSRTFAPAYRYILGSEYGLWRTAGFTASTE